ncbi:MAG: hypothetical protein IJK84_04470, partial [Bacteroidales bacterium]|nr:hypothetical protein [Bacteroidales bacterium]
LGLGFVPVCRGWRGAVSGWGRAVVVWGGVHFLVWCCVGVVLCWGGCWLGSGLLCRGLGLCWCIIVPWWACGGGPVFIKFEKCPA